MTTKPIFEPPHWPSKEEIETRRANRAYIWRGVRKTVKWTLITAGLVAIVGTLIPSKDQEDENTV